MLLNQALIRLSKTIVLAVLSAIVLPNSLSAKPVALTPFDLKPIKGTQLVAHQKNKGMATVTMIYQPDCSWCKKQGQTLAKAFEQCSNSINVALVGTKGSKRVLKKELKHYHQDIPAFIADRKFLRAIGGYQASPTTLIYDANGQLIANKRGFIAKEKLADAIVILSQGNCVI
ncbi:thioredoxin family protein [Thalassotalea sp. M1531]|uniref:Thioredoxin family protein n=1 Tax=Thalassotalea algicola TaxID=2716224 RepID=A0A7Y0LB85_9GAMM|nr:thioredoxin family protein [Thalassotalea algicola]NMP31132.1 thioredoxin family protein [Thalassotalea algicola]